ADPTVDLGTMVEWKDGIVGQLTGGVEKLCKANGVNLVEGRAEFAGSRSARVIHGGEGQGAETIEFEHAIVATGSRPMAIPGFDFSDEPVLDSAQALSLTEVPDRLLVVGAGYIGMELSTVFARLGSSVTVVEMLESVLPGYPDDLTGPVRKRAKDLGVEFYFGQRAVEWTDEDGNGDGVIAVTESEEGEVFEHDADRILVAVGREPVTDTVNLEAAGVETDDRGFIPTDDRARTNQNHIYAVGDVAGEPMLAHKGSAEGEVAAEVIAGEPAALDYQAIPAAVFTDPEIGTVGMTAAEAEEAGFDPTIGEFPFRASGRALTTGESEGFVKLVADTETGFVLGGQVVGREASELIAEIGLAIEMGATLEDVAATVHTHPTLSESVMEAAKNGLGHAIHSLNR
ncbi:MAG: FAD-dependent oxidoreductase, partial [Halobacteriales archaeon]|nr:FAD-dependent oxidoreductase [Halobacteriales archaeon]